MEELHDITVSLITCSPGHEVWANYGHTALRVQYPEQGLDLTFNYGLFSFDTPHFIWRFCTGETDYCVGAFDTRNFLREYKLENRQVTEQVLDLPEQDKENLWNALLVNCQPENRYYRYNFFYDNCATRVRDMIVRNSSSEISYNTPAPYGNLRDVLNFYTEDYSWTGFGISMLLGSETDAPASLREQMFAPEIMQSAFANATVDGHSLVKETNVLCSIEPSVPASHFKAPAPYLVTMALFIAVLLLTGIGARKSRRFWGVDIALNMLLGLMGCVIFFLAAFSSHPCTSPNWLLLFLNPLELVYAVALCFPRWRNSNAALWCSALWLLPVVAAIVVLAIFNVQYMHIALLPLMLALIDRSVFSIISLGKSRKA